MGPPPVLEAALPVFVPAHRRQVSACHCEPVRTLVRQSVFPAGKLGKLVVLRANSLRLTNSPEVLLSVTPYRRRSGLSRRFAPRNDRQKLAACPRLQLRATSQTRSRLRIRLKCCFSFCAAAGDADCPVALLLAMPSVNLPGFRTSAQQCNVPRPPGVLGR